MPRRIYLAFVLVPIALLLGRPQASPATKARPADADQTPSSGRSGTSVSVEGAGQGKVSTGQKTGGLTPQDRQKVDEAIKNLPPSEQEIIKEAIDQLTPEQRAQLAEQVKALSPAEQKALAERASQELANYKPPHTYHVIEGPGVPPSQLVDYMNLTRDTTNTLALGANASQLLTAGRRLTPNLVVFRRRTTDAFTDRGIGNGILVSKSLILTARHVAEEVKANPGRYELIQVGRPAAPLIPLAFVSTMEVSTSVESGDPDIALVKVAGGAPTTSPTLADGANVLKQHVASIGSSEFEGLFPSMGTGIITASLKTRELDRVLALRRTVVGSSIRSFPGLSGAPVFRSDGAIVAVILGGVKRYSPTGETVTRIPAGTDWEAFPDWTWATPVGPLLQTITSQIQRDR